MARRSAGAIAVAAGIFLSRIFGLVRERVFAHYFGNADAAGAFKAALKIPNLLQNLFGEGVLSASFIPVYARLLAEGRVAEAGRVAGVVASLLVLVVSTLVALGVAGAELMIDLIAPGFDGEVRALTITLVRIMFPGVGLLVLSAWCLGVLNSHKRFFLSYVAPVLWNVAQIATLIALGAHVVAGRATLTQLATWVAWATVAGAALQLVVQLPQALALARGLRPGLDVRSEHPRRVLVSFGPMLVSRGVVQLSAYIDQILASFIGAAAVAAMAYAQQLYLLPVSLFGMAVSAAELPEMSSALGSRDQIAGGVRARLEGALPRVAYFVIPSAVAFFALGDVVVATLFQTGRFGASDVRFVWLVLAGATVGLIAVTQARLLSSAFYALSDTRTPLGVAVVRVALGATLGWALALPVRERLGWPPEYGATALAAAGGAVSWVELVLLRRALVRRIGAFRMGAGRALKAGAAALGAAGVAFALGRTVALPHPILRGAVVLGVYGALYLAGTAALGLPEAKALLKRVRLG